MDWRIDKTRGRSIRHLVSRGCSKPERGVDMTKYCFGDTSEEDHAAFEEHVLQCEACWEEVQRLEASVQLLRTERALKRSIWTPGTIGVLGISGRLHRWLAGHQWSLFGASFLYALLFALSLLFEIAYEFDHFGRMAVLIASLGILPGMLSASLGGLSLDWQLTRRGKRGGLWLSILIAFVATVLVVIGAAAFLPDRPITLSRVQAQPAESAYLKDTLYYLPLWVLYAVIPYHAILMLQRELKHGRYRSVLSLLGGDSNLPSPRGCIYLRVWQLGLLLGAAMLASFYLTGNLLDNLKPSPGMNLFISLIQIRTLCYFTLGVGLLFWYSQALNEIKRECVAALRVERSPHDTT